jgi:hypothetical protein
MQPLLFLFLFFEELSQLKTHRYVVEPSHAHNNDDEEEGG